MTSQPFTEVRFLADQVGETVRLRGWVRNARTSKTRFIELRDGSGFVQCVVGAAEADPESYELAGKLTQEAAITLTGLVQQHPKTGQPELPPPLRWPPSAPATKPKLPSSARPSPCAYTVP